MVFLKVLGKVVVGLIIAALLVVTAFLAWRVWRAYWPALLFYAYLAIGLISAIGSMLPHFLSKQRSLFDVYRTVEEVELRRRRFGPLRALIQKPLRAIVGGLGWPYYVTAGARHRRHAEAGLHRVTAALTLEGQDIGISITALVLVAITYGAMLFGPRPLYAQAFLALLVVHTMTRHTLNLVGLASLPTRLRQARSNPYRSFLVILACDYLTLVLAFNGVMNWDTGPLASWSGLWHVVTEMAASPWERVKAVVMGGEQHVGDLLIGVSGLLYAATIGDALLRFGEFRRSDDDYRGLAMNCCLLGEFNQALKHLQATKSPTAETETVRAVAYLGVNQLERVQECITRALRIKGKEPVADAMLVELMGALGLMPVPPELVVSLTKRVFDWPVSDGRLTAAIQQFPAMSGQHMETLLREFEQRGLPAKWPLSHATLLFFNDKRDESQAILSGLKPTQPLEIVLRHVLSLVVATADPKTSRAQDAAYFEQWYDRHYADISDQVHKTTSDEERVVLAVQLFRVSWLAEMYKSPQAQSLVYLRDELKGAMSKELAPGVLDLLNRVEQQISSDLARRLSAG